MFAASLVVVLVLLALTASIQSIPNNGTKINPDTVDSLDLPKYLGLWYQMAADQIVYSTFEKDAFCDTALYGDNGDGTISVHNYARIHSPTSSGDLYTIDGYAYIPNPSEPGQLKVVFNSDEAAPFPAPYWILDLGPVNENNQYDWAIVSDNLSAFLFVLARDVDRFNEKYKADVYSRLTALGFTGKTAPIDTYHEKDCVYESTARYLQMKKFKEENKF